MKDDRDDSPLSPVDMIADAARDLLGIEPPSDGGVGEPPKRHRSLEVIDLDRIDPRPNNRVVHQERVDVLTRDFKSGVRLEYPIIVRVHGNGDTGPRFQAVDGMHRILAFRGAGLTRIPCIVDYSMSDDEAYRSGLTTNRKRWQASAWDDFIDVLTVRADPNLDHSIEGIADFTSIGKLQVERLMTIQDHVAPELWPELEKCPDSDTVAHLRMAGRIGRRASREGRRDQQLWWWSQELWKPRGRKRPLRRRPKCSAIRAKAERLLLKKYVTGEDAGNALLWAIGERRAH